MLLLPVVILALLIAARKPFTLSISLLVTEKFAPCTNVAAQSEKRGKLKRYEFLKAIFEK